MMKVYEMKPEIVGNAVETDDAIVVTLNNPNRVIIIAKKDIVVGDTTVESIRDVKEEWVLDKGAVVAQVRHNYIHKNILDEFRHAKNRDEMMAVIKRYFPSNKKSSQETLFHVYKRAVENGVVSVPMKTEGLKKRTAEVKKQLAELKYLPVKEKAGLGKSLNDSVALGVYKRYQLRLWNNAMADLMSRVNSAIADKVSNGWFMETFKGICGTHDINYTQHVHNAWMMWLKDTGLVSSKRGSPGSRKIIYTIHKRPEIPRTIST